MTNSYQQKINNQNREKYLNMSKLNNDNQMMTIIEYNTARDINVQFKNGEIVYHTSLQSFNRGAIRQPEKRIGHVGYTKHGDKFIVLNYIDSQHVDIEFQDKWKYKCIVSWQKVITGSIKNPYHPNKYGGIIGTNKDICDDDFDISTSKEYNAWFNILLRAKDMEFKKSHKSYLEVTICDEWMYFWNFYKWCKTQDNYHKWQQNENWAIDKDIMLKGNKEYSPRTCCIVPQNINNLLLKHDKRRGNYPIGVTKRKTDNMFEAQCSNPIIGKYVTIGIYNTYEEAFKAYKLYKEKIIADVANVEYSTGNITHECYLSLLSYSVEIND